MQIQSIDGYNNVVPGSLETVERQTAVTHRPVTDFTGIPTSGTAPLGVFFRDNSTNYPSSWNWSFGDRTLFNYSGLVPLNPIHTYYRYGTYTVSLTTANAMGSNTTTKTGYITVTNATTQIGVVRNNSTWILDASGNGVFGTGDRIYTYGKTGDRYVSGDWDNDNVTEIGVVRNNTTWLLDATTNGVFDTWDHTYIFGKAGDAYVTGDWNADRKTEIGVVRNNRTWLLDMSGNGAFGAGDLEYTFGESRRSLCNRGLECRWQD